MSDVDPIRRALGRLGVGAGGSTPLSPSADRPASGRFIRGGRGSFWFNLATTLSVVLILAGIAGAGYWGYRLVRRPTAPPATTPGAAGDSSSAPVAVGTWCAPDRGKMLWVPVLGAFAAPGQWPAGLRVAREDTTRGVTRRTYLIGDTEIEMQQMSRPGDPRGLLRIRPAADMSPCAVMQATGWLGIDSVLWSPGHWGLRPPAGLRAAAQWRGERVVELRIQR